MRIFLANLKAQLADYKLFFAVATISLAPIWGVLKVYSLVLVDRLSLLYWFHGYDATIIFVLVAIALKTKSFSILASRLILISTLIGQVLLFGIFFKDLNNNIVFILFLISILFYICWVIIYFLIGESGLIDKKLTFKGGLFFVLMAVTLYFTKYLPLIITKYQTSIITEASGIIINIWTPAIFSILIVSILFFLFLYFYTVLKESFFQKKLK